MLVRMAAQGTNAPNCLPRATFFSTLAIDCPGDHKHASWQPFRGEHGVVFPTAMEAEYPPLLCNRMAECVRQSAAHMGVIPSLQPCLKELLNLNLGHQTLRHEPLIPEYATVFQTDAPLQHESHKLLSAPFSQGHHSTEQPEGTQEHKSKRPRKEFKYGVWHTPEQFLTRAEAVVHPMGNESFCMRLQSMLSRKWSELTLWFWQRSAWPPFSTCVN